MALSAIGVQYAQKGGMHCVPDSVMASNKTPSTCGRSTPRRILDLLSLAAAEPGAANYHDHLSNGNDNLACARIKHVDVFVFGNQEIRVLTIDAFTPKPNQVLPLRDRRRAVCL